MLLNKVVVDEERPLLKLLLFDEVELEGRSVEVVAELDE